MACLSPWALGSVYSWAEFGLRLGIALVTILGLVVAWGAGRWRHLACLPSLCLAGLVLYSLAQTVPLPVGVLRLIAPASYSLRESLIPPAAEQVLGDPGPRVALPPATLSQDCGATVDAAASLAGCWLLFQGVLSLGAGSSSFRRFGAAIMTNSVLLTMFSLVQRISWNGKIYWIIPSPGGSGGPFVCHNHLAAYLNLGLGLALGVLIAPDRSGPGPPPRGRRLLAAYAAALIVVGILASLSRSGFVATLGALVVLIGLMRAKSIRLLSGLGGAVVVLIVMLISIQDSSSYFGRLNTILHPDESLFGRGEVWSAALQTWRHHPLWGTGLGSFASASASYFHAEDGRFYARAENEYLDLLVEGGLIGLGLASTVLLAVARLGRRALTAAPTPRHRALVRGALFGLAALAIQSLGDFALHIPGVAITALVLAGHLCRMGLDDGKRPRALRPTFLENVGSLAAGLTMTFLSLVLASHAWNRANAEILLMGAGLPTPGSIKPSALAAELSKGDLERGQAALAKALRYCPDSSYMHAMLGLVDLELYEWEAMELIGDEVGDPVERAVMADPLWLLGMVDARGADPGRTAVDVHELEPVRHSLVPAARQFLEARRCCAVAALAHARLASLHFLLDGGESASAYAERALRLAGSDDQLIGYTARVAVIVGDQHLTARCWRKSLEVHAEGLPKVSDDIGAMRLAPDLILEEVAPDGRSAIQFAGRLYASPEDRPIRERFLKAALERLPGDRNLDAAERLWYEGQAWAGLEDPDRARGKMLAALAMEPFRAVWRSELVERLLKWGMIEEAHDQAVKGIRLTPDAPVAHQALELAAGALSRRSLEGHAVGRSPPGK